MNVIEFLQGYKTYILAFIGLVIWLCYFVGWIDYESALKVWQLLGIGTVFTLRAAISKSGQSV